MLGGENRAQGEQGLAVLPDELVEDEPSRLVVERPVDIGHARTIGKRLLACQGHPVASPSPDRVPDAPDAQATSLESQTERLPTSLAPRVGPQLRMRGRADSRAHRAAPNRQGSVPAPAHERHQHDHQESGSPGRSRRGRRRPAGQARRRRRRQPRAPRSTRRGTPPRRRPGRLPEMYVTGYDLDVVAARSAELASTRRPGRLHCSSASCRCAIG